MFDILPFMVRLVDIYVDNRMNELQSFEEEIEKISVFSYFKYKGKQIFTVTDGLDNLDMIFIYFRFIIPVS